MPLSDKRFIRRHSSDVGWYVKIRRGRFNIYRYFSDADCGGREKSFNEAKKFRNTQEKYSRRFLVQDHGGFSLQKYGKRWVYMAAINIAGKRYSTSFGCIKYGDKAKEMAATWLEKKRAEKKRLEKPQRVR